MLFKQQLIAAILVLPFSSAMPAQAGSVGFRTVKTIPVGTAPKAVIIGEFNGDGWLDLAVANSGDPNSGNDGSVTLVLGGFLGQFRIAGSFPAGKNPQSIAAGDFNGDGKLDLAVANPGDTTTGAGGTVTVLLGNGDGTFQSPVAIALDFSPRGIVAGDFNGDLKTDLAVAGVGTFNGVAVLLGNGDGTFQTAVKTVGSHVPNSITVADFNSDGKADLAVARFGGIDILLGNGDGSFQLPTSQGVGFVVSNVVGGDFNRDHNADVAVLRSGICFNGPCGPPGLALLLGNGDGTLQQAVSAGAGNAVTVGDFDGDGNPDFALYEQSSSTVQVLLGNGDGTFQAPLSFAAPSMSSAMTVGDFDHDNAPDLVLVSTPGNSVSLLPNKGTDFSISASPPTPGSISAGQSTISTVTLSLLNGFRNPVSISCSVQTSNATCSLNSNSVAFDNNGKGTLKLTVSVPGTVASFSRGHDRWCLSGMAFWMPIAGIVIVQAGRRSRRYTRIKHVVGIAILVLIAATLLVQVACGGSGTSKGPSTLSVIVQASTGFVTHSTTVVVTEN